MLMARPGPVTLYTTVSVGPVSVVVVSPPGDAGEVVDGSVVVLGAMVVVRGVVVGVRDVVLLGSGIGGSGATAVSCSEDPLEMNNATTSPITSSTAVPATTQSQRGD